MRHLPHSATLLRPSTAVDEYGDPTDGPLAPVGSPFPAWLQRNASDETTGEVVTTTAPLFVRLDAPAIEEDDVIEVEGSRYRVKGNPYTPVNPRGRGRLRRVDLVRVSRGG